MNENSMSEYDVFVNMLARSGADFHSKELADGLGDSPAKWEVDVRGTLYYFDTAGKFMALGEPEAISET
jgi:hypothetical protein